MCVYEIAAATVVDVCPSVSSIRIIHLGDSIFIHVSMEFLFMHTSGDGGSGFLLVWQFTHTYTRTVR